MPKIKAKNNGGKDESIGKRGKTRNHRKAQKNTNQLVSTGKQPYIGKPETTGKRGKTRNHRKARENKNHWCQAQTLSYFGLNLGTLYLAIFLI